MARRTAAVSAISLTVVVAAAACGPAHRGATQPTTGPAPTTTPSTPTTPPTQPSQTTGSPSASTGARPHAACGTKQLRWTLTRLADKSSKEPTALLSATNTGTTPCAFDGYPHFEVHLGKGPSVSAKPKTTAPVRLVLNHGRTVDFPLFYPVSPARDGYCSIPVDENPSIEVRPPHPARTDYGTLLQLTDAHGRHLRATVCDTIHMGSPRLR